MRIKSVFVTTIVLLVLLSAAIEAATATITSQAPHRTFHQDISDKKAALISSYNNQLQFMESSLNTEGYNRLMKADPTLRLTYKQYIADVKKLIIEIKKNIQIVTELSNF